jgi:hypothetical protein
MCLLCLHKKVRVDRCPTQLRLARRVATHTKCVRRASRQGATQTPNAGCGKEEANKVLMFYRKREGGRVNDRE